MILETTDQHYLYQTKTVVIINKVIYLKGKNKRRI